MMAAAALLLCAVLALAPTRQGTDAEPRSAAALVAATENPHELSAADIATYQAIADADRQGQFSAANSLMGTLSNRLLVGHMLATRYLGGAYKPSNTELADWLSRYSDHPEATRIAGLAIRRGMDVTLPKTEKPLKGAGYTDHEGRTSMPDGWYSALGYWRSGEYAKAAPIFASVSENENLSNWQRAAAYYWDYRASDKLGDDEKARDALTQAARYPTTFYGMLASTKLGLPSVIPEAPEVRDALRNDPRAIRAALLVQLGDNAAAEDELRALHSALPSTTRAGIVTLASELNLPNLQMRLARTTGLSPAEQLFAQYPAPAYMSELHTVMDPALLMAVARNESGFRELAHNPSGAMGMMQMLPSTARAVERHVGEELLRTADNGTTASALSERLSDPALSARYGAEYLKLLTKQPAIGQSLVHLLVGYNAGPGTVASWQAASANLNDPLLYIESIPYAETRNYVMQVAAQYWVYQRLMDKTPTSLIALSKGQWPKV